MGYHCVRYEIPIVKPHGIFQRYRVHLSQDIRRGMVDLSALGVNYKGFKATGHIDIYFSRQNTLVGWVDTRPILELFQRG